MTAPQEQVRVTQVDRSRAVDAVRRVAAEGFAVGCCNMSLCDADEMAAYIAKDFARHRTAAEAASAARVAELVAMLRQAQDAFISIDEMLHNNGMMLGIDNPLIAPIEELLAKREGGAA